LRLTAPTAPTSVVLVLGLAGALVGWIGCGSTVLLATSGSGVGGSGSTAKAGPTTATSAHVASSSGGGFGGQGVGGQGIGGHEFGGEGGSGPGGGFVCPPGFAHCGGNPPDLCETNIESDPANCGACGAICTVPHATAACVNGQCAIGICDSGWTDCNDDPTDGCEANLQNDPMNCGACGMECVGQGTCVEGSCSSGCDAKGYANCPGDPQDVCTPLGTNANCNFCGDTCDLPNSISQCQQNPMLGTLFVCTLQSCLPPFANCDMNAMNGCETNVATDANNCGACGDVCDLPNAVPSCNQGTCAIAVCNAGYADCNETAADGCEVDTNTDPNNCGGCGHQCGTPSCSGGVCGP
jgi:hypothetical protein